MKDILIYTSVITIIASIILGYTLSLLIIWLLIKHKNNLFTTNSNSDTVSKTLDDKLINAKEAYKSTEVPQLKSVINDINTARKSGRTSCSIADREKLHHITIDMLLGAGYNIHVKFYQFSHGDDSWSNRVTFDETADGKLTFGDANSKKLLNYPNSQNTNFDIIDDSY